MKSPDLSKEQPQLGRRLFLNRIWLLLASIVAIEFGWVGFKILKSKSNSRVSTELESIVVAGNISEFAPGSVTPFPQGQFYLACLDDGSFLALSRSCTHLHCSVPWDEGKKQFVCPCHGSAFDLNGDVLRPPAPRPLDLLHVRIENGVVKVDPGQVIKRDKFDPSQATRI